MITTGRSSMSCWSRSFGAAVVQTWTRRRRSSFGSFERSASIFSPGPFYHFPHLHISACTCAQMLVSSLWLEPAFPQATANHCFSLGGVMNPSARWCLWAASSHRAHLFRESAASSVDLSGIAGSGRNSYFMSTHICPTLPSTASFFYVG